jgi:hypothetical protein
VISAQGQQNGLLVERGLGGEDHQALPRAVGVAPHVAIKGQIADPAMTVELGAVARAVTRCSANHSHR